MQQFYGISGDYIQDEVMIYYATLILYILYMRDEQSYNCIKEAIDKEFANNKHGQILLPWAKVGLQGAAYLSSKHNQSVLRVGLMSNNLTDDGVRLISKANWNSLKSIDLGRNNLGNKSCKFIAHANWKLLQQLTISSNYLEAAGLLHLLKGDWPKLEILCLQVNKLREQSVKRITKGNWTLNSIMLFGNDLPYFELNKVVLGQWPLLSTLWAKGNPITQKQQKFFEKILSNRFTSLCSFNMR